MTGLIIFTLFCLVLIIYLSVRHNRLLKSYVNVTNDGHEIAMKYKEQRIILSKYNDFVFDKDLMDDFVKFVEGRE